MSVDRWHTVEQIGNHTYRIDECGVANAYLLVGESRALLIDTGNGIGDISRTVRALTSLPLTVALTHHHCDHAGGVGFFDGAYVHEADLSLIYTVSSCKLSSRWLCSLRKEKYEFPAQPHRPHLFRCVTVTFLNWAGEVSRWCIRRGTRADPLPFWTT